MRVSHKGEYPMGTHAITGAHVVCLFLSMNNNAIPQTGSSVIASILSQARLGNPFLAADNEISHCKPAPEAAAKNAGPAKQVLKVVGYEQMTADNCNRFRKAACAAWNGHTDVEIDLSETTFIDCAGLGALIAVRNLTHQCKGIARLMNPTPSVQQLLDFTRTGQLFDIVNTPEVIDLETIANN